MIWLLKPRITPAYAGNTLKKKRKELTSEDHPRIRGEHKLRGQSQPHKRGSPPHTRGTQVINGTWGELWGITPAYAGNTGSG